MLDKNLPVAEAHGFAHGRKTRLKLSPARVEHTRNIVEECLRNDRRENAMLLFIAFALHLGRDLGH